MRNPNIQGSAHVMDPCLIEDLDLEYLDHLLSVERYLWAALSYDLLCVVDLDGRFEEVNPLWEKVTGHTPSDLEGGYLIEYIDMPMRERVLADFQCLVTQDISTKLVSFRFLCRDGSYRQLNWSVAFSPEHNAYFCVVKDATARRQNDVLDIAYQDALTGLHNRLYLMDHFPGMVANSRERGRTLALLFLDLDGFKQVNDSMGHKTGDALLQGVASRLKDCTKAADAVVRLGGDEFVILLRGLHAPSDAGDIAGRIVERIGHPYQFQGSRIEGLGCSIGISVCPDDSQDLDTLMELADQAMYRVKRTGKNAWAFHSAPC